MKNKIPNGTLGAYHEWIQKVVIPENLEHYLKVTSSSKVVKGSRGWRPVGWKYLGNSRPYVPVGECIS